MKPETEQLLHQCRTALLQQSNEQLDTLFVSWFERLVGEESVDEALDDLCLLLGYGIRSLQSHILYATYTAWWEVEGEDSLDGEFECVEVAALQHHLITMPIKQFALVTALAYHVCALDAEVEGQPCPPTGQEWLRALAVWLGTGAQEPFHSQLWRNMQGQLNSITRRVFRRRRSDNAEFKTLNLSVRLSTSRHNLIPHLHLQREQTINARRLLSLMPKTNRFLHSLELDKLLGDGPELLGMVRVQRIGQIAGEG